MDKIVSKSHLISILSDSLNDSSLLNALETVIIDYKKQKSIRFIPLNLFSNRKLGVLEVIVKYLKENHNLSYHEIAVLISRDDRTIWTTYNKAVKKHKDVFDLHKTDIEVDIGLFANRKQAPLEVLVKHLREKGMSYTKIAELLKRSYKTIWITDKKK